MAPRTYPPMPAPCQDGYQDDCPRCDRAMAIQALMVPRRDITAWHDVHGHIQWGHITQAEAEAAGWPREEPAYDWMEA
jgi:hypothetical protein